MKSKVAVIGGGSWGTALALLLAHKGKEVSLWVHNKELCREMGEKRENTLYLPGFPLPPNLTPLNSLQKVSSRASTVLLASPSHVFREVGEKLAPYLEKNATLVCVTKGIENESLKLPCHILEEIMEPDLYRRSCYLSGPNFAKEVAKQLPTAATVASLHKESALKVQKLFNTPYFRLYSHHDVLGVELGGALKNVIAIAAGVSDGMGNGQNARAALITRGLAEMSRLGKRMGADPVTFAGLAGIGDLVLTCAGDLSRNRTVGIKLGQGKKLKEILEETSMVAEGVKTSKSVMGLAQKLKVELPIIETVYAMLYEDKSPGEAIRDLMERELKEEF